MGSLSAAAFSEQVAEGNVSLRNAVSWHLTSNHYPPHPTFMVPVAVAAVEAGQDEDWDRQIDLPLGCLDHKVIVEDWNEIEHATCEIDHVVTWRNGDTSVRAGDIIESFRLESFL